MASVTSGALFVVFIFNAVRKRRIVVEILVILCIAVHTATSYIANGFATQTAVGRINFLLSDHIVLVGLTSFTLLMLRSTLVVVVAIMNIMLWVVITLSICIPTIVISGDGDSPIITQLVTQFFEVVLIQLVGIAQSVVFEKYCRKSFKLDRKLDAERRVAEEETNRSHVLLSNILPTFFVEKLIERGIGVDSGKNRMETPDISNIPFNEPLTQYCDDATVILSDIVGFTSWSSATDASDIVFMLNHQFSEFDQITSQVGLEKVKTIGDAYFCIGGLDGPDNQCMEAVEMSLLMVTAIERLNRKFDWSFEVRIGVGAGPVRAAVFGNSSITFDCFGEAVDIARLMESSAYPGCVQVSEKVYRTASHKYDFIHFDDHEGEKVGKSKGYLLRGKRNEKPVLKDLNLLECPLSPSLPEEHKTSRTSFDSSESRSQFDISIDEKTEEIEDASAQHGYKFNKYLLLFSKFKHNLEAFEFAKDNLQGILPLGHFLQFLGMLLTLFSLLCVSGFSSTAAATTFYILVSLYVPIFLLMILCVFVKRLSNYTNTFTTMLSCLETAFLVTGFISLSMSTTNAATFQFMYLITVNNMNPHMPFIFKGFISFIIAGGSILIRFVAFRWINYADFGDAAIVLLLMGTNSYFSARVMLDSFLLNKTVKWKIQETKEQQQRNNTVLQSSLPAHVIQRLKLNAQSVHDHVEHGSVCFIELDRFRDLYLKDGDLAVTVLNHLFTCFDELATRHGCLKIKSIGNVYLVVAGIFADDYNHLQRLANFAIDARTLSHQVIEKYTTTHMPIDLILSIKIGIQAGNFEACVLGTTKFLYDVFGDTINTASRMMSTGEKDKIQVSGDAVQELERDFELRKRGSIYVKGKGDVEIYMLQGYQSDDSFMQTSEAGVYS